MNKKENHDGVLKKESIIVKLAYLNGEVKNKVFSSIADWEAFAEKEGDQIVNWSIIG